MSESGLAALASVVSVREARQAIEEALIEEANSLVDSLRAQVRSGQMLEAAKIDARIAALEEVPAILERHAAKYRRS